MSELNYYRAEHCAYACGPYNEITIGIFANTESEALGFALEYDRDTRARNWEINEFTQTAGVSDYI
jgi:hypothetical protein